MSSILRWSSRPRRASRRSGRAYRGARGLAVALLASALAGCESAPPHRDYFLPESARAAFLEGCAAEADGHLDEALPRYRSAVLTAPHFVSAHRALQNVELARHRRGELLLRYGAWRDADPR